MEISSLYPDNVNRRVLEQAVQELERGELVVYPTDSHPAVGVDATNVTAVQKLCRLKNVNPEKQTLTIVCSSIAQASQYARIDNRAFRILKHNTPGPFTFILPPASSLPKIFKGRKQVGIRIPNNNIATELTEAFGRPLLSGSLGTSDPAEFENSISRVLVDATADPYVEVESSAVVDLTDSSAPEIIREGPVALSF